MRRQQTFLAVLIGTLLFPSLCHADAGVPLIGLQMPALLLLLLPVILIESYVFRRSFQTEFTVRRILTVIGISNAVSTLVGFPLARGFMLAMEVLSVNIPRGASLEKITQTTRKANMASYGLLYGIAIFLMFYWF